MSSFIVYVYLSLTCSGLDDLPMGRLSFVTNVCQVPSFTSCSVLLVLDLMIFQGWPRVCDRLVSSSIVFVLLSLTRSVFGDLPRVA